MKYNDSIKLANLNMLQFAASKLQTLCDEVVFLGGCTTAIFITDKASPDVRYTLDVDCIVDVISLSHYYQIEKKLEKCGFNRSIQDDVICRWHYDDLILDIMPTDKGILGFGNQWYKSTIIHAERYMFSDKLSIKVTTAPYFLATKLEAFKGRGNKDYYASHDLEDIISVLDGRLEIVEEVMESDRELKNYLSQSFSEMINDRSFHDALPGHFVQHGNLLGSRIEMFLEKLSTITNHFKR